MTQLFNNIRSKLKKWFIVYTKAYSGNVLWPVVLFFRQALFKQVAISITQFLARGLVLDVGTGPGHLPIEIARSSPNVRVIGIDIALELLTDGLKKAKKEGLNNRVSFLRANIEFLPFANDTFEMVQSVFSLHLWNNQHLGIGEIYRVLKPEGRVQILVGRSYLVHGLASITDYFTRRSISRVRQMCFIAGFNEVHIKGVREFNIIAKK